jgi:hypothetical protein
MVQALPKLAIQPIPGSSPTESAPGAEPSAQEPNADTEAPMPEDGSPDEEAPRARPERIPL